MSDRDIVGSAVATTLNGSLNAGASSCTITSATGWPSGTGSKTFVIIINRGESDEEKVLVESRSGTTLTFDASGRGYDGTSDQSHATGATVELIVDAVWLAEVNSHLNATADAHTTAEITDLAEFIRDTIGTALVAGGNIDITVSDGADTITIDVESLTSGDVTDFTEAVQDVIGALASGGSALTMTYTDGSNTWVLDVNVDGSTIEVNADALRIKDLGVTTAKINDLAVTTGKINDDAVTKAKIAPSSRYQTAVFGRAGTLIAETGQGRFYFPRASTIVSAWASVGTAPTGASLIVDVNHNGTTIFTTQSERPTIAASGFYDESGTPDGDVTVAAGEYATVDIDQVGSTIAGADLTVGIVYYEDD